MKTWRQILSYRLEEDLKVGDTLYLAAPEKLLRDTIGIEYDDSDIRVGSVITVEYIDPDMMGWLDDTGGELDWKGVFLARGARFSAYFPLSHWKEFFTKT